MPDGLNNFITFVFIKGNDVLKTVSLDIKHLLSQVSVDNWGSFDLFYNL